MLMNRIGFVWKMLPPWLRLRIVRATQTKFTVSVAAVIFNRDQKVLLLNHVLRPFSGWGLPGGFVSAGESPDAAIRREIREETGLELEELALLRVRTIGPHVEILFTATAEGAGSVLSPREILDLGWFDIESMPEEMSGAQKKVIRETAGRRT